MRASCTCCVPATPRCKPPAPAVQPVAAVVVLTWRCTALRSLPWPAGWAWCRCELRLCGFYGSKVGWSGGLQVAGVLDVWFPAAFDASRWPARLQPADRPKRCPDLLHQCPPNSGWRALCRCTSFTPDGSRLGRSASAGWLLRPPPLQRSSRSRSSLRVRQVHRQPAAGGCSSHQGRVERRRQLGQCSGRQWRSSSSCGPSTCSMPNSR